MDEQKELQKQRELIDSDIQEAKYVIKLIMVILDKFYPGDNLHEISEKAYAEKQYFRSKVMDCINNIGRYISESRNRNV